MAARSKAIAKHAQRQNRLRQIIVIEHDEQAEPDNGLRHLARRGISVRLVRPYLGEDLPMLDDRVAGVIIKGGPQYVTDLKQFPYLRDEISFADRTMKRQIPLLGICLGAQMIAHHLGADVGFHPEGHVAFGYYPTVVTDAGADIIPDGLMALSGNAQGFDCPKNAELLATGPLFPNQAFRHGPSTIALQFHPEVTRAILDQWQRVLGGNVGKPGTHSFDEQDEAFRKHNHNLALWYGDFLDRFFSMDVSLVA
ncbi:glutamine amidotransferase-related protein [Hoeflea sp.]|uniref:glutamine amidotransferase-related protein n=1 Tax=Hoeflea sp. TaxID=1940281 RepID=UPI003B0159ED